MFYSVFDVTQRERHGNSTGQSRGKLDRSWESVPSFFFREWVTNQWAYDMNSVALSIKNRISGAIRCILARYRRHLL